MIKKVTFLKDFKRGEKLLFRKDEVINFASVNPVNLLVGDQGTGKSTLIWLLRSLGNPKAITASFSPCERITELIKIEGEKISSLSFDFEKDSPRASHYIENAFQVSSLFSSHGEVTNAILDVLKTDKNSLFILDEPDNSLSYRSILKLYKIFLGTKQVIAAVHNPRLIELVGWCFDMGDRNWKTAKEFFRSQEKL